MNLELSEEQNILKDSAAKLVKIEIPIEKIRELADNPKGLSDELWNKIAEQGWLGILIPEDLGGLSLGATELGIIM